MTVLKILTYTLVSTWSSVSSGWEHVKRKMHPWYTTPRLNQRALYMMECAMYWCKLQLLMKLWQSLQALAYKSPSGVGNLTTCGWVSGKRYTADMSSPITASLTCAQRLTLHAYCLLSGDFTHITLNFSSYLQQTMCMSYVLPGSPSIRAIYWERGVFLYTCPKVFEYTHIELMCTLHCTLSWCALCT